MRIGIDVGGTNTDAVILDNDMVIAATKAQTSADVVSGIIHAINTLLGSTEISVDAIDSVMIGTTQFTNAVVERRELSPVAAIRIGMPSGLGLPPMIDWPSDIADALGGHTYMLKGGYLYDGRELASMDDTEIDSVVADIKSKDIKTVAISSVFSPMNDLPEQRVANRLREVIPDVRITLSNSIGSLGLLERENGAILNACLLPFADRVVNAFGKALATIGLKCPMFVSQNDGTLMSADFVRQFPALTFASGPTNSLRGAFKLTGLADALVVDIGGTTADIGVLQGGFPRESGVVVDVGGVRTNFRMPDILPLALGGGSLVSAEGTKIGPHSLGHRLLKEGLVFGGETLTATDLVVASGAAVLGNPELVKHLPPQTVARGMDLIHRMIDEGIDMMRPGGKALPVILVGGGSILVTRDLQAATEIHSPEHSGVANAIGAAIAQIGGESEHMFSYKEVGREAAIEQVTEQSKQKAILAGASADSISVLDIEETPIPYMDEDAMKVRVKVVGDIAVKSMAGVN